MLDLLDQGGHHIVSIFAFNLNQQNVPGMTLDQSRNMGVVATGEQIAFPMPGYRTIINFGRTLPYRDRVNDLSASLSLRS